MKNVGLIGAGRIAPFYVDVLKDLQDVNVSVAASDHSLSAQKLSESYKIKYFEYAKDLIEHNDFIIVACRTSEILSYVKSADALGKYILAEKPFFDSLEQKINLKNPDKLMIGFNRRQYRSVQALKEVLRNYNHRCTIKLEFPERLLDENQDRFFALRSNGVHAIDLASYLVGGLQTYEIDSFSNELDCIVRIIGNKHNALLSFNLNAKASSKIWFHDERTTHVLSPIERYSLYESVSIKEADVAGKNIRTYTPVMNKDATVDDRLFDYKPGFEAQIQSFLHQRKPLDNSVTPEMCKTYLEIVETIINHVTN